MSSVGGMARISLKTLLIGALWATCLLTLYFIYPHQTYDGAQPIDTNLTDPQALQRLQSKLEFVNGKLIERDYELKSLRDRLQQAQTENEQEKHVHESDPIHSINSSQAIDLVPNLFKLMPHIHKDPRALMPHRSLGHFKHNADMVLAVPHVHREKEDYLISTLTSLFTQMSKDERSKTVIVVMVAEPFNESIYDEIVAEVSEKFSSQIKEGDLEVILPPAKWYPDLDHLPEKWGDDATRAKWRTKQNLDYAFMMLYCSHIGELYVQLEDDITAKPQYIAQMKKYASSQDRWELLEFSQLGFIGKMFRTETLPKFVTFVLMFYKHKPVDWLLDNYFWVQECHGKSCTDLSKVRKRFRPSLFQHDGYYSSLTGKVQKLKDKDFNKKGAAGQTDPVIFAHPNPPASVNSSLKAYQQYTLAKCYEGKSVFWALNPQPNDYMMINFNQPVSIKSYKIVSGDRQHKDDRLGNSSLEFMPVFGKAPRPKDSFLLDNSGFVGFQYFNTSGKREADDDVIYTIAEGVIPSNFGLITAARIMNHVESQNWLIISELWFAT
ncbi:alpha-1,3-mannosyl-glycoprotein 4-beta-N-acetylglucosaminyltransferase A-like [Watersipora subatra]|uniref:alpha-1,3-mannosyl-glycoprotein 4-beta-N-acetylglucosaminyltransferase A-like n=1 Tax=Watersipora subatra TaxID=2589382 RepID=UPI00355B25E8